MGKMPFGRAHVRAGLNDVILVQQRPAQRFSLRTHLAILLAQCGDALRLFSSQWAQYGGVSGFHHVILCRAGWEMMDRFIDPASLRDGAHAAALADCDRWSRPRNYSRGTPSLKIAGIFSAFLHYSLSFTLTLAELL